tara:strand:- start:292 stop:501 length:210 start_codon:yes stop_codon:yes gene_type:complete
MNNFHQALTASTDKKAIALLELDKLTVEELEELAWCFAFNNGDSRIAPSKRESALAHACMDQLEKLENE